MPIILSRLLLAALLLSFSLSVSALPNLSLGPYGPGAQDGAETFNALGNCSSTTAIGEPGDDCGDSNMQVRTQDVVVFNWSITANDFTPGQDNPENVILEQILSPSTNAKVGFEKIPVRCTEIGDGGTNPPSSIEVLSNGDTKMTCNLGEMAEGAQISLSFVAQVSGESRHGETFTSTQRVYSNADDGTPNANPLTSPELGPYVISARPMFDLSVGTTARSSIVTVDVGNGNGPEKGYYVYSTMRVSSPQRAGVEAIQQPFDFESELTATKQAVNGDDYTATGFEYYLLACQYNTIGYRGDVYGKESYGASNLTSYPIERKVIDSGVCSGARTDTNDSASPYTMTFDQADLSGNRFPTEGFGNVDLSAGDYYYINMWARYFIPMRVVDNEDGNIDGSGSIYIKNTLKDFDPIGLSGGLNFGTLKEPGYNGAAMPDGSKSNNITQTEANLYLTTSGSFADYAFKTNTDTGAGYSFFEPTSSHSGAGLLAPGQSFPNTLHFGNNGVNDLHNPRACVSFDNTTVKLTDRGNTGGTAGTFAYIGTYAGSGFDSSNYIVEYGNIDFTGDDTLDADHDGTNNYNDQTGRYEGDWTAQKAARCDDNSTTWVTDPTLVAGGIDNVNMVRARLKDSASTTPFTTSQYIRFVTPLQIRDTFYGGPHNTKSIPIGTVIAQFGRARSDEWGPNWTPTDPHSYSPAPENSSSAGDRVTVSRTAPRLNSESLTPLAGPGQTAATLAGKPVVWKVTTAIQSLLDIPPQITNVKIIDELPPEVTYNRDCTTNYTDENGDIIGTPAHLVEYNTDRNGDPKPGYTRLTWNLGTVTANTPIPDRVICTDSDSLSPTGTNVTNYAELSGDGLIGIASQKTDTHTIKLEQAGSMQVSKKVDLTLDNTNDTQEYTLAWSNFAPNLTVDAPVVIDVFPFNGDDGASSNRSPKSEYVGALQLLGPPTIEWKSGAAVTASLGTWFYTTDDPNTIDYNPDENSSNWVAEASLSGDFSQVTAIKFVAALQLERDGDPHQGMSSTYTLQAGSTTNPALENGPGNIYTNLFTLDTTSLPPEQFLKSNSVTTQIAAYSVGDLVFADVDGNLRYDSDLDIPAPNGVTVHLHNASDDTIVQTTTLGASGKQGRYLFNDLNAGNYYITIPASEFAPNAALAGWNTTVTTAGLDDDENEIGDQDGYTTSTVIASGIRTHVFELSAIAPGPGEVPKGEEPLGDNTANISDSTGDDFSNFTLDIALVPQLDFGDAPDSYGSAGHGVPAEASVYLGNISPDTESQPQNTANGGLDGKGDDNNGKRDEDGTALIETISTTDTRFQSNVSVRNKLNTNATLIGWIDFDNSGTFDANEAQSVTVNANFGGTLPLVWDNIPAGTIQAGPLWLRLRVSTDDSLDVDNATGPLFDGEVEDYEITVGGGVNVSGRVFIDANSNATNDASEAGVARHTLVIYDELFSICRSTYTDGSGYYMFSGVPDGGHQVYQADGESVPSPQNCDPALARNPPNYTSTTPDAISILVATTDIVEQNFGEVKGPTFEPDHQSEVLPGGVVFYAHTFSSPAAGSVSFATSDDLAISADWSHLLYHDENCNGALDSSEAATPISGTGFPIDSNDRLCIINKVFAPSNAAATEQYRVLTTASFTYAGGLAGTTILDVKDLTTTGEGSEPEGTSASRLDLRKTVQNTSQNTAETETINSGAPGEFLTYRIYYENLGTGPINDLSINDAVPPYTGMVLNSARCDDTPSSLVTCSATTDGDYINWEFTGILNGGDSGFVSYEVMINE